MRLRDCCTSKLILRGLPLTDVAMAISPSCRDETAGCAESFEGAQ